MWWGIARRARIADLIRFTLWLWSISWIECLNECALLHTRLISVFVNFTSRYKPGWLLDLGWVVIRWSLRRHFTAQNFLTILVKLHIILSINSIIIILQCICTFKISSWYLSRIDVLLFQISLIHICLKYWIEVVDVLRYFYLKVRNLIGITSIDLVTDLRWLWLLNNILLSLRWVVIQQLLILFRSYLFEWSFWSSPPFIDHQLNILSNVYFLWIWIW